MSFESRYGTLMLEFFFSEISFKQLMTLPSVSRLLLMFILSLSLAAVALSALSRLAVLAHSLPARSTRWSLPFTSITPSGYWTLALTRMVKRQCERED